MAATSTNKQPLFIDRVLHYVVNLDDRTNNGLDPQGGNTAALLVDAISSDGAIIEDIYLIARPTDPVNNATSAVAHTVNLYMSTQRDYLRPNESSFIGTITSATTAKEITHWEEMPRTLAPVPQVDDEKYNNALYIPKGYALWAAREGSANISGAPLVGCQGGWY